MAFVLSEAGELAVRAPDNAPFPPVRLKTMMASGRPPLHDQLLDFRDAVGDDLDTDPAAALEALTRLRLATNAVATDILRDFSVFDRLAEYCFNALPPWPDAIESPPLIELDAPHESFPTFELLPLLDLRWPEEPTMMQSDIDAAASSFLGFAGVVRRVLPATVEQDILLRNKSRLPVAFIRDATMDGAAAEFNHLTALSRHVDVAPPWPEGSFTHKDVVKALGTQIFHATRGDGTREQVQHFACHAFTGAGSPQDWSIQVASESAQAEVTIADILLALRKLRGAKASAARNEPLPLVFMNACGGSTVDPSSAISFPWLALRNGNRAFVGAETRVPDAFAAAFSNAFYRQLLTGSTIGNAVHAARWELLRRHGNPLGILYTLYGNPDLRIEHTVPKEELYV